jgi:membrane associated rhomboid family serine protease
MPKLIFRYHPNPLTPEVLKAEKRVFRVSLVVPVLLVVLFWLVKIAEVVLDVHWYQLGVYPRSLKGITGILSAPFIHGDFSHLINNSVSFLALATALFFFYRKPAPLIFIFNFLLSGLLLWLVGRDNWHIGASGVVYGMAAFLFVSGLLRSDTRLLTIALVVTFLYGSFFWGLLPIDPKVSWDGHLAGAISGLVLAYFFRHQGPPKRHFEWENENDEDAGDEDENAYWKIEPQLEEQINEDDKINKLENY